jgi:hypothetical protein
MVSFPNAENVVKPPSTPMNANARVSAVKNPGFSASSERNPIVRHPRMLTISVPTGNDEFC